MKKEIRRKVGRPSTVKPPQFDTLYALACSKNSSYTHKQAYTDMGMCYTTYKKLASQIKVKKQTLLEKVKALLCKTLKIG